MNTAVRILASNALTFAGGVLVGGGLFHAGILGEQRPRPSDRIQNVAIFVTYVTICSVAVSVAAALA